MKRKKGRTHRRVRLDRILLAVILLGIITCGLLLLVSRMSAANNDKETLNQSPVRASEAQSSLIETDLSETAESSNDSLEPTPKEQELIAYMDTMTIEEKVGQLFLSRCPTGYEIDSLNTWYLAGFVLFSSDFENESSESFIAKVQSWQQNSKLPLLIASDEEGGTVSRVSGNQNLVSTAFLSPQALYEQGGWDAIITDVKEKSQLLLRLGINVNLAPVADVSTTQTSFIYTRTIGMDAAGTSEYIHEVIPAMEKESIGSCLKHFPGYSDNQDSHTSIVYDSRTKEQIKDELEPFIQGIKDGADSVLVSHNIIEAYDAVPASLSSSVHSILRDELNFTGVIMTDDMDMAGLANYTSQEEAAFLAIQAGNDLVMSSKASVQIPYVLGKIASGELSEDRINESVKRVLAWKQELGLL